MKRRQLLQGVGAGAATVVAAGCSILGGCGPGADSVEDLKARLEADTPTPEGGSEATAEEVRVKGAVQAASEEEVLIDDGTGTALLVALGGFSLRNIDGGECVWATGFPTLVADEPDADIMVLITDVGLAE